MAREAENRSVPLDAKMVDGLDNVVMWIVAFVQGVLRFSRELLTVAERHESRFLAGSGAFPQFAQAIDGHINIVHKAWCRQTLVPVPITSRRGLKPALEYSHDR